MQLKIRYYNMALTDQKISTYKNQFLFDKQNFKFVLIGLGLMVLGFLLMMGGKTTDPNVYNADELYSFRRITLAPILIIAGLIVQIYAILLKPKKTEVMAKDQANLVSTNTPNKTENQTAKTIYLIGQKCKTSGTYVCVKQPDVKINLKKGEKFPSPKKIGGKGTEWQLQQ